MEIGRDEQTRCARSLTSASQPHPHAPLPLLPNLCPPFPLVPICIHPLLPKTLAHPLWITLCTQLGIMAASILPAFTCNS